MGSSRLRASFVRCIRQMTAESFHTSCYYAENSNKTLKK